MFKVQRALCIFERNTGDPAWRHYSAGTGRAVSRPKVELVVRFIPTLGNYDYVIDYVFERTGQIRVRAGATGLDAVKTVAADVGRRARRRHGKCPRRFRRALPGGALSRSLLQFPCRHRRGRTGKHLDARTVPAARAAPGQPPQEPVGSQAQSRCDRGTGHCRPRTSRRALACGQSREKQPYWATIRDISSRKPDRFPRSSRPTIRPRRALHSQHTSCGSPPSIRTNLWPAGDFPNQSKGGDGLPLFVADREPVENKDLVLWYSLGFRHVTRPEDWPLLPTRWFEFRLRPYGFFIQEPSHSLAPHFSATYPRTRVGRSGFGPICPHIRDAARRGVNSGILA